MYLLKILQPGSTMTEPFLHLLSVRGLHPEGRLPDLPPVLPGARPDGHGHRDEHQPHRRQVRLHLREEPLQLELSREVHGLHGHPGE